MALYREGKAGWTIIADGMGDLGNGRIPLAQHRQRALHAQILDIVEDGLAQDLTETGAQPAAAQPDGMREILQ